MSSSQAAPRSATLQPVWHIAVELTDRDCVNVREAVGRTAGLRYGDYDSVCFETAIGTQYFRPLSGSHGGEHTEVIGLSVRVLTFSIPRDDVLLAATIDAITEAHSYEEPVIHVTEALATRAVTGGAAKDNPNKWWNQGFAHYSELGRKSGKDTP
jgi:hypothetical protein